MLLLPRDGAEDRRRKREREEQQPNSSFTKCVINLIKSNIVVRVCGVQRIRNTNYVQFDGVSVLRNSMHYGFRHRSRRNSIRWMREGESITYLCIKEFVIV